MINKLIILVCLLLLSRTLAAQQIPLVVIVASTSNKTDSLAGATLQLYALPDTILLNTQTASIKGNTFLVNVFKAYLLKATKTNIMKKLLIFLSVAFFFVACNNNGGTGMGGGSWSKSDENKFLNDVSTHRVIIKTPDKFVHVYSKN